MQVKPLGTNKTEIRLPDIGYTVDRRVLFSYETPVAYAETGPEGRKYFVTDRYYSRTTTRHIKSWLPIDSAMEEPQDFFDALA